MTDITQTPKGGRSMAMQSAPQIDPTLAPAVKAVFEKAPALAAHQDDFAVVRGRPMNPGGAGGQLESYPPEEAFNPMPGKATTEVFNSDAPPQVLHNLIKGDFLHRLGAIDARTGQPVDQNWRVLKTSLLRSMTPEQEAQNRAVYDWYRAKGDPRSFKQFMNTSRGDEYIMGSLTPDQGDYWRGRPGTHLPSMYTPEQEAILGRMRQHLIRGYADGGTVTSSAAGKIISLDDADAMLQSQPVAPPPDSWATRLFGDKVSERSLSDIVTGRNAPVQTATPPTSASPKIISLDEADAHLQSQPVPPPPIGFGQGLEAAGKNLVKGAEQTGTSALRGFAIGNAQGAPDRVKEFDRISAGDPTLTWAPVQIDGGPGFAVTDEKGNGFPFYVKPGDDFYDFIAEPARRNEIYKKVQGYNDPRDDPAYKQTFEWDEATRKALPTTQQEDEGFFTGTLPQGLGSTATFLGVGALTGPAGVAAVSSGSNADQQFSDAILHGADLPTAFKASNQGAAIGLTEMVPVEAILSRLDSSTGGWVRRGITKMIIGGTTEGAQEFAQQILNNASAASLYDPTRDILTGAGQNTAAGGVSGALLGFLTGLVHAKAHGAPAGAAPVAPAASTSSPVQTPPVSAPPVTVTVPAQSQGPSTIPGSAQSTVPPTVTGTADLASMLSPGGPSSSTPAPAVTVTPAPTLSDFLNDPRPSEEIIAEIAQRKAAQKAVGDTQPKLPDGFTASPGDDGAVVVTNPSGEVVATGHPDEVVGKAQEAAAFPNGTGARDNPVSIKSADDIATASAQIDQNATPAQLEAGNYSKAHGTWQGLNLTIETPRGGTRTAADGSWAVENYPSAYGYVKKTQGADGDHVDVFIGDAPDSGKVWVIDQTGPNGWDEHKALIGFKDRDTAINTYRSAYTDDVNRIGGVTEMSVMQFRNWVRNGDTKKPLAYEPQASIPPKLREYIAGNGALSPVKVGAAIGSTPGHARQLLARLAAAGEIRRNRMGYFMRHPKRGPLDAIAFLQANGGIRDNEGHNLARGRDAQRTNPAFGPLIRRTGMSIDEAGERLHEAGFFGDPDTAPRPTVAQVLELLEQGLGGRRSYRMGDETEVLERAEHSKLDHAADMAVEAVDRAIHDAGLVNVLPDERSAAVRLMIQHGYDPLDALDEVIERAAIRQFDAVSSISENVTHESNRTPAALGGREGGARRRTAESRGGDEQSHAVGAQERPAARNQSGPLEQVSREASSGEVALPPQRTSASEQTQRPHSGPKSSLARAIDFEQFAAERGASRQDFGDAGLHRGRAGMSNAHRDRALSNQDSQDRALERRRADLRQEYDAAVERGEVRPRSALERLEANASGHPDNEATQAARRLLQKRGGATDRTDQGDQAVIPGAERISDRQLVERKADERLKPKAPQKAADDGLFDTGARNQGNLLQGAASRERREPTRVTTHTQVQVTPEFAAARESLIRDLKAMARQVLGEWAKVAVFDKMTTAQEGAPITGSYNGVDRLIAIALTGADGAPRTARELVGTLLHEGGIHYFRDLGVLSGRDWRILQNNAKGWRQQYQIDERYAHYAGRGYSGADLESILDEEAIAEAVAHYRTGERFKPGVDAIMAAFWRFLDRVRNLLAGRGFREWGDVFEDIASGKLAERADRAVSSNSRGTVLDQTAYHGTPHEVGKFTTEKVGSGEGHAAYGWGLYFAGNKEVAEHYQRKLSFDPNAHVKFKGQTFLDKSGHAVQVKEDFRPAQKRLLQYMVNTGFSLQEIRGDKNKLHASMPMSWQGGNWFIFQHSAQDLLDALIKEGATVGPVKPTKGNLYHVDLKPEEDEYLDLDKPLSEQSDKVKAALDAIPENVQEAISDFGDERNVNAPESPLSRETDYTGKQFYRFMTLLEGEYNTASEQLGIDAPTDPREAVSKYLNKLGIRGNRYLDGDSRRATKAETDLVAGIAHNKRIVEQDKAAGRPTADIEAAVARSERTLEAMRKDNPGTSNYVIFDDKDVEITHANGGPLYQMADVPAEPAPPFFSKLSREIDAIKQSKAPASTWLATLRNKGVKEEEIAWTGLDDFLHGLRQVTKTELQGFVNANGVEVRESIRGGEAPSIEDAIDYIASHEGMTRNQVRENWGYSEDSDYVTLAANMGMPESRGAAIYAKHTLPGGENYRELLLTLPNRRAEGLDTRRRQIEALGNNATEQQRREWADIMNRLQPDNRDVEGKDRFKGFPEFNSSHFNERNVLAHIRFDDRIDQDGKRVLFIEEIQSDWHQKGRRFGYKGDKKVDPDKLRLVNVERFDTGPKYWWFYDGDTSYHSQSFPTWGATEAEAREDAVRHLTNIVMAESSGAVPRAPFRATWQEMAFRRAVKWAADHGYDRVAWTTGEQQADRYDLSKRIGRIDYQRTGEDRYEIEAYGLNDDVIMNEANIPIQRVEGIVGKEIAQKIEKNVGRENDGPYREWKTLEGLDLKVGGEGMQGFYDNILPAYAAKFGKKFDAKVGQTYLSAPGTGISNDGPQKAAAIGAAPVHSLDITPAMRDTARREGFPLFQAAPAPSAMGGNLGVQHPGVVAILTDSNFGLIKRLKAATTKAAIGTSIDSARTALQDRFLPLLRVQQQIEKQKNTTLADEQNAYVVEETFSGRVGDRLQQFDLKHKKPLLEAIHAAGLSDAAGLKQIQDYLYARHAPERNAAIAKINEDMPDGGSGMTNAQARAIMDRVAADPALKAKLEGIAKLHDAIHKETMRARVEYGLMSQADADAWARIYSQYTPLRGRGDLKANDVEGKPRPGQGYSVRGKESKQAMGRKSRADDLLAYSLMQAEEAIIRGEKNRVGQALLALVRANPDPSYWEVGKLETKRRINADGQVEDFDQSRSELDPNVIVIKENGESTKLWIADDRLVANLKNIDAGKVHVIVRLLARLNRFLSLVNTGWNLKFVITNALRDLQGANLNLAGIGKGSLVAPTLKNYAKVWPAVWGGLKGKSDTALQKRFREYTAAGGKVDFWTADDIQRQRSNLERELRNINRAPVHPLRAGRAIFELIERANQTVENAIRFSVYMAARDAGATAQQAASLSKNITVNFNRRGELGPWLNAFYLFYNASIQGTAVMGRLMTSKKGWTILGAVVAAGLAEDLLNGALSPQGDDGEDDYDKIPDYVKERNLIIMAGDGGYFKIPLPYGFNAFHQFGRNLGAYMRGQKTAGAALGNAGKTFLDAFNPAGDTNSLLNFFAPTILDPFVEIFMNEDYAGRPIMPRQDPYGPPAPDSQRYFANVTPISQVVASRLNEITGGDDFHPGAIDVSPESIDHIAAFLGGGAWTFFKTSTWDLYQKARDGEPIAGADLPLVNAVIGRDPETTDIGRLYDRLNEIEVALEQVKTHADQGKSDLVKVDLAARGALISLKGLASTTRKQLKAIRGAIAATKEATTIDEPTRADRLKKLEAQRKAIVDAFNATYNKAVGR